MNQSAAQLATMAGPILGGLLGGWMPIRWIFVINGSSLVLSALLFRTKKLQKAMVMAENR